MRRMRWMDTLQKERGVQTKSRFTPTRVYDRFGHFMVRLLIAGALMILAGGVAIELLET